MGNIPILDDDAVAEIEAREPYTINTRPGLNIILTATERDALCRTVRALRAENEQLKPSEEEIKVLTDYHYYEAEKAITRRGDSASQRLHLERLSKLRGMKVIWP